ncbi:MAG: hypothetical protein ACE5HB_11520, partial [Terriglobia bacterium]
MARIQRHELKHDELVDTFDEALLYVEEHGRSLAALALAVVLAGGSLGGFYWYSQNQEAKAGAALSRALTTYQAPVQAALPPLPGQGPERTVTSEQEP